MSEDNKARIRRVIEEVYNRGDLDLVDDVAAADLVIHSGPQDIRGREGAKQYVAALRAGFPDLRITIEDQVAEGDMVVTRWSARGTHRAAFQGVAATDREVRLAGTDIDRILGGKVVECWSQVDELGLLRQLGAVGA
jgi:predicted ester cyclase